MICRLLITIGMTIAAWLVSYAEHLPYSLSLNGRKAMIEHLDVSAVPQNMVWPGYQRPIHQRRTAYMTTVDCPGDEIEMEVTFPPGVAERALAALRIRPLSRKIPVRCEGESLCISFPKEGQFVLEFPDVAPELHVFVNKPFTYKHVEGNVYFGPGVHEAGIIRPTSGQTVCIDNGAVVYGMLYLDGVHDVRIVGRGILDSSRLIRTGNDGEVFQNLCKMRSGDGDPSRNLTQFWASACTNVTVEGITFRDSPFWTVILYEGCRNFAFDNVKIVGQWRYNSDGFDICASQNVTIRNSFVRTFDDCVVARGCWTQKKNPVDGLLVENCVLWCDWGKNCEVCAGSSDSLVVRNVIFRKCALANVTGIGCDVTVFIGGIGTQIENVAFEDLEYDFVLPRYRQQMQDKCHPEEPFGFNINRELRLLHVDLQRNYCGRKSDKEVKVRYRGIRFTNPRIVGEQPSHSWVRLERSSADLTIEDVTLQGLPSNAEVDYCEGRYSVAARPPAKSE